MTSNPSFSLDKEENWNRFCDLLWYSEDLGIWLDISKMNITNEDFLKYNDQFLKAFEAQIQIEQGSIANIDENRQVGHYWLRNPSLAPDEKIQEQIKSEITNVEEFSRKILDASIKSSTSKKFTDVLWIGIGGSSLGPMLIVDSLGSNDNALEFHFLDNVDPKGISIKLDKISDRFDTTLFVVVSKSGSTPEPQICMEQTRYFVENNGVNWPSQAIAITMESSTLDNLARDENWLKRFQMQDWIGGRTSITSSVGLLPAALVGADINKFIEGACEMDKLTRKCTIKQNPSALLALSWLAAGKNKGIRDMVVLPYCDSLQLFSRYLQQLVMESLGKKYDRDNNLVNQGLAVYGNKGSTDQHAYVQQLRDGIDNFFVVFIESINNSTSINAINNRNPQDYILGFLQGTRSALTEAGKQSLTLSLEKFNTFNLGALVALFERAVGIYAEIVNINAYHQPGVEAGKKAASQVLDFQNNLEILFKDSDVLTFNEISNLIEDSSKETIYSILRNLVINNKIKIINGKWNKPHTMEFKMY